MHPPLALLPRRRSLLAFGLGGTALLALPPPLRAGALLLTPRQSEGPFYPLELPAEIDADLVRVTGAEAAAMGQVTHLTGRVLDPAGRPLPRALIEIWQCDAQGRYLHPGDRRGRARDPGFQGYGRTLTDAAGGYHFRTIRPVAYPGRTPHIHIKVRSEAGTALTSQIYVRGEPGNARDGLLNSIRDPALRERLMVSLETAPGIEAGALAGSFDIVLAA